MGIGQPPQQRYFFGKDNKKKAKHWNSFNKKLIFLKL
jgi:hypothetical protein